MTLTPAFVALGANLGNPVQQIAAGVEALAMLPNTRLTAVSPFYRSAPVGYAGQPDFVNAVAKIETALAPRELLDALLAIERDFGRIRDVKNGPRTLDLDIALYGDSQVSEPGLEIPHPRMRERAFVLVPLADIDPDQVVPGLGRAADLLAGVDATSVEKMEA